MASRSRRLGLAIRQLSNRASASLPAAMPSSTAALTMALHSAQATPTSGTRAIEPLVVIELEMDKDLVDLGISR